MTDTHDEVVEQPTVRDYRSLDELNECSYHDPEEGRCNDLADYALAVEYQGNVKVLPFCEEHANVGDGEVSAE